MILGHRVWQPVGGHGDLEAGCKDRVMVGDSEPGVDPGACGTVGRERAFSQAIRRKTTRLGRGGRGTGAPPGPPWAIR